MARVVDRDKGYKKRLKSVFSLANGPHLTVGIQGDTDGQVAAVAGYHEFGTEHIPARSFIAAWADDFRPQAEQAIKAMALSVMQGRTDAKQGFERLGVAFVASVQARMAGGLAPDKADGTPCHLINTGQLRSSIKHKVER